MAELTDAERIAQVREAIALVDKVVALFVDGKAGITALSNAQSVFCCQRRNVAYLLDKFAPKEDSNG